MANHLKMAVKNSIFVLKSRNLSNREIARQLGISRNTVNHYLRESATQRDSNCAKAPPGSDPGSDRYSASQCRPFHDAIVTKRQQELSAQRIYQDLVAEHGFTGSYYSVRRYVYRLEKGQPLPFRRLEALPGEEVQIDFGVGAPVVSADGKRRRTYVLRIVLSCSRKGYSEVVYRQTTDAFLGCLENAFWYFGGVPRTLVIDNLKAAVTRADWYDPDLHPKIQAFAQHYGTVFLPTKPYMPRHKGKVERGVGYVKSNGLKGRTFETLAAQNAFLLNWEQTVADTRLHGTTHQHVGKTFQEIERPALSSLPKQRFECFTEQQRCVHRDGHVEVARAYYSVPPEYVGQKVWVRWDGRLVRIFDLRMRQIVVHSQVEPGRFQTAEQHLHSRKVSRIERGADWLLRRASLIGPWASRWSQAMLQDRGVAGIRVLNGLLSLAEQHRAEAIEKACKIAVTHRLFRLQALRKILQHGGHEQQQFEFVSEHEIIRDLDEYDQITRVHFT